MTTRPENWFWVDIFWPRSFLSCASAGHWRRSTTGCCMSAHRYIKGTTVAAQQRQRPIPPLSDSRWATRTPCLALQTLPDMLKVQNLLPAPSFARNNVSNIYKRAFYSGRNSLRKMGLAVPTDPSGLYLNYAHRPFLPYAHPSLFTARSIGGCAGWRGERKFFPRQQPPVRVTTCHIALVINTFRGTNHRLNFSQDIRWYQISDEWKYYVCN